jgi:hypothetical protein
MFEASQRNLNRMKKVQQNVPKIFWMRVAAVTKSTMTGSLTHFMRNIEAWVEILEAQGAQRDF